MRIYYLQVVTARTGNEAVAVLAHAAEAGSRPIDAVLKAHDPPDSNGPRFLQKLRGKEYSEDLPVVGMCCDDSLCVELSNGLGTPI